MVDIFESPNYVRTSLAAAMTLDIIPGKFLRNCKLYCINLLLTYDTGCLGRCAYCGLSRIRQTDMSWSDTSFIRVDWPTVALTDVISRMQNGACPHVERICVSMITHKRACDDLLQVVEKLHETADELSALITPTIIEKDWLHDLKSAGADMVGVAIDAATPALFEQYRGRGVRGPHSWNTYWQTVKDAVEVFGEEKVGVHLIVGLGETEEEMTNVIQDAQDMGASTHLFSFYPEPGSPLENHPQPPIGQYRRIQLARYLINNHLVSATDMRFRQNGQLEDFGMASHDLEQIIHSGRPFLTSGCHGETMDNACNRPFANCTPYQAYIGELRNFPFQPNAEDIKTVISQLTDLTSVPDKD